MKVRMKVSLAGPDHSWHHGEEVELPDALAEALCSDGRAEPIEPPKRTQKKNGRSGAERTTAKPADSEER